MCQFNKNLSCFIGNHTITIFQHSCYCIYSFSRIILKHNICCILCDFVPVFTYLIYNNKHIVFIPIAQLRICT